ncbi:hypothetical protein [Sebaldella sp. S0638]|uniref:hypothetical protein n=1 Tax=Sebaldella sp. S0638 TaxID=2957809 RepID=UPI0020A2305A|nr:hypothetical protein [Sebaldella sp. S0638]MCP1223890.1 hypothetical protein [Sebaldella sp. S0638]
MQIETFKTKCQAVTTGGKVRGVYQTLEELQEEVNDFIRQVKVFDIKHTIEAANTTIHYFTVIYEEEE